jgi:hypothetical protein
MLRQTISSGTSGGMRRTTALVRSGGGQGACLEEFLGLDAAFGPVGALGGTSEAIRVSR